MPLTPREVYEREYAREQARLDARDAHEARRAAAVHAAGYERGRRQNQGCVLGCAGVLLCALFLLGCWLLGSWLEPPPSR